MSDYHSPDVTLLVGDCRMRLAEIPDKSIKACICSPPYFGLRSYGTEPLVWDAVPPRAPDVHVWGAEEPGNPRGASGRYNGRNKDEVNYARAMPRGQFCEAEHTWATRSEYHNRGDATAGPKQKSNVGAVTGRGVVEEAFCTGEHTWGNEIPADLKRGGSGTPHPGTNHPDAANVRGATFGAYCTSEHDWTEIVKPATNGIVNSEMQGNTTNPHSGTRKPSLSHQCGRCSAWRGHLGMEPIPDCLGWARGEMCNSCYICHLRLIFGLVRRVLRDDGLLWVVIGDSFSGSGRGPTGRNGIGDHDAKQGFRSAGKFNLNIPEKNLIGVPWRLALALQADGWIFRQEIVWAKTACMPESTKDRCTRSHEAVLMFAKQGRYFYDALAVAEPTVDAAAITEYNRTYEDMYEVRSDQGGDGVSPGEEGEGRPFVAMQGMFFGRSQGLGDDPARGGVEEGGRSTIQREPAREREAQAIRSITGTGRGGETLSADATGTSQHPEAPSVREAASDATQVLPERQGQGDDQEIPADPEGGGEPESRQSQAPPAVGDVRLRSNGGAMGNNPEGAGLSVRDVRRGKAIDTRSYSTDQSRRAAHGKQYPGTLSPLQQSQERLIKIATRNKRDVWVIGPESSGVKHFATYPTALVTPMVLASTRPGDTVLDPFSGAGTTVMVARALGRKGLGIELSEKYHDMASARLEGVALPLDLAAKEAP